MLVALTAIRAGQEVRISGVKSTYMRPQRVSVSVPHSHPTHRSQVRFDYEEGARRGTYWGSKTGRGRPVETNNWRAALSLPTPPPTCEEPDVVGAPPSAFADWHELRACVPAETLASPGRSSTCIAPGAHSSASSGEGALGASCSRWPHRSTAVQLAWEGSNGGDAILAAVVGLLRSSEWLQRCSQRSDGKTRLWQLVATHLPGRTAAECQERWRAIHTSVKK